MIFSPDSISMDMLPIYTKCPEETIYYLDTDFTIKKFKDDNYRFLCPMMEVLKSDTKKYIDIFLNNEEIKVFLLLSGENDFYAVAPIKNFSGSSDYYQMGLFIGFKQ
jgi:hypothetical protein